MGWSSKRRSFRAAAWSVPAAAFLRLPALGASQLRQQALGPPPAEQLAVPVPVPPNKADIVEIVLSQDRLRCCA